MMSPAARPITFEAQAPHAHDYAGLLALVVTPLRRRVRMPSITVWGTVAHAAAFMRSIMTLI